MSVTEICANKLPAAMVPIWEALPCVVTGVRTHHPTLPFASVDHHDLVFSAFEKALALGYKRPALIIDEQIDVMLDRRFSAGFASAQEAIARSHRVPVFSLV